MFYILTNNNIIFSILTNGSLIIRTQGSDAFLICDWSFKYQGVHNSVTDSLNHISIFKKMTNKNVTCGYERGK